MKVTITKDDIMMASRDEMNCISQWAKFYRMRGRQTEGDAAYKVRLLDHAGDDGITFEGVPLATLPHKGDNS